MFSGSIDPHMLVLLAYVLALTNRFPEPLIREIFKVDFLAKLDTQLESMCHYLMLDLTLAVRIISGVNWCNSRITIDIRLEVK